MKSLFGWLMMITCNATQMVVKWKLVLYIAWGSENM